MNQSASQGFSKLKLPLPQQENLKRLGYQTMTPVQAQSLPFILAGRDVIAQAKTGSGKTVAFGLGVLQRMDVTRMRVQALVLCPTRELAEQVAQEIRRLAQAIDNTKVVVLSGGKPFGPQKASLQFGAHIAVGTPGRVLDHLRRNTLSLTSLRTLVLDEADRLLDMGFADDMDHVVKSTPKKRQTLLFSATYPDTIRQLSNRFQTRPQSVTVDAQHEAGVIQQLFFEVAKHERHNTLLGLFEHYTPESAVVFCQTKKQCADVAELLNQNNVQALAIHGDLEQRERDRVLLKFNHRSCPVLVATDVAARGLDVKTLQAVINYELPRDPEIYVHRIGRTGRAGERGLALSLFTPSEQVRLNAIESYLKEPAICDYPESLDRNEHAKITAPMTTLEINVGRKNKLRPGDILGALTGDAGLPGSAIGKIDIFDMASFVAIDNSAWRRALEYLDGGRVKGRTVRARRV